MRKAGRKRRRNAGGDGCPFCRRSGGRMMTRRSASRAARALISSVLPSVLPSITTQTGRQ